MLSTADDSYCWYLPHIEEIEYSESYFIPLIQLDIEGK
jgi:hypothetical protein